jgi:hypothetical protein
MTQIQQAIENGFFDAEPLRQCRGERTEAYQARDLALIRAR